MGNALGPDVSFYQDDTSTPQRIDFEKMNRSADYVIIRAGQNLWSDRDIKYNWSASKAAGLPRGSYWFYDSRAAPKRQAEKWVETLEGDLGELPLFADIEETYGGQYAGWRKWYDFLERLKELVGQKEIAIYTAYYYWRDNAPNPNTEPQNLEYFHQYPLWIANYDVNTPRVPKPWDANEWLFWQFTVNGDGVHYGVESKEIDLNYFNGDVEAFRERFGLDQPSPGAGDKYRVELSLRNAPGMDEDVIGTLEQDEILEVLETSVNKNWIRVKREDDTTGWIFNTHMIKVEATPPPQDKWYRVTASVLNVREGPSTSYTVVGSLRFNSVVKGLEKNDDGTWIKILRASDGLTGWCSAAYLDETSEPPPTTELKNWYEVNATTLNVRNEPNALAERLGYLSQGQTVLGLEANADKTWVRIQRFDGLVGWASAAYLTDLGTTAPEKLVQRIFPSVVYYRQEMQSPRQMVAHVLAIDTQANGLKGLVTPPSHESGLICTRKTSKFLEEFSLQVAINGDGFSYLDPDEHDPQEYCPSGGDPVKINSYAASRGNAYSEQWAGRPILYVNRNLKVSFNEPTGVIYNAVSGDRMLVEKGQKVGNLEDQSVEPRSAAGTNSNGRWLFLVVIDGRQPGYSEGATFPELADFMLSLGIYNGLNLDGGGSSAIVIEGALGGPFVLNSPIEGNIPGNESEVGNHLGFWVKK